VSINADIVNEAKSWIGKTPYVYGGASLENGADCSGFTMAIFAKFGIQLSHATIDQSKQGEDVGSLSNAQAADVVYFGNASDNSSQHCGIYVGLNTMIDAAHTGTLVRYDPIIGFGKPVFAVRRHWSNATIPLPGGTGLGLNSLGAAAESVPGLSDVINTVNGMVQILQTPGKALKWFTDKNNVIRIIKGIIGVSAMGVGVLLINEETIMDVGKKVVHTGSKVAEVAAVA
jgi:hypothetical protein